jgi:hypothetical protein
MGYLPPDLHKLVFKFTSPILIIHYVSIFVNNFLSVLNKADITLMLTYNKFLFLSNELRFNFCLILFCVTSCCFNLPCSISICEFFTVFISLNSISFRKHSSKLLLLLVSLLLCVFSSIFMLLTSVSY